MPKFLHTADIHLDSPLLKLEHYEGAPVEELRGASRRAFESLVSLALEERADFVLIAGDLYDGDWKDYNTGLYFVSQMSKLRDAGIDAFIVAGNHDAASRMTKTIRFPENVHFFPTEHAETFYLEHFGVAVHGQGFSRPAVKKDLSLGYPTAESGYFNIGMLHTGATGRENHDPYAPCTVDGLCAKGYDYWALGHIHQHEILHPDPPIVFSGNIQGRHIRETGPKGCMLVSTDERGIAEVGFQALDGIRWAKAEIDAREAADDEEVMERIHERMGTLLEENEGLPLASRVEIALPERLYRRLSADPEQWTNEVRALALDSGGGRVWVEKVRLSAHKPESQEEPSEIPGGPMGEILQFFEELRTDEEQLRMLGQSLNDLWKKLPRELKESRNEASPDNLRWLADTLEQVRPMLIRRLMPKGNSE